MPNSEWALPHKKENEEERVRGKGGGDTDTFALCADKLQNQ